MKIPCENCLVLVRCRLRTKELRAPIKCLRHECEMLNDYCIENETCSSIIAKGGRFSSKLKNILYHGNVHANKRGGVWCID